MKCKVYVVCMHFHLDYLNTEYEIALSVRHRWPKDIIYKLTLCNTIPSLCVCVCVCTCTCMWHACSAFPHPKLSCPDQLLVWGGVFFWEWNWYVCSWALIFISCESLKCMECYSLLLYASMKWHVGTHKLILKRFTEKEKF